MLDFYLYLSPSLDRLMHVLAVHQLFQMPTVALTHLETLSFPRASIPSKILSLATPVTYLQLAYLSRLSLIDSTKSIEFVDTSLSRDNTVLACHIPITIYKIPKYQK